MWNWDANAKVVIRDGRVGYYSVLYVKVLVGAFNQEKALVGAFSVIVQLRRLIVCSTTENALCRLWCVLCHVLYRCWYCRLLKQMMSDASHLLVSVSCSMSHVEWLARSSHQNNKLELEILIRSPLNNEYWEISCIAKLRSWHCYQHHSYCHTSLNENGWWRIC